MDTYFSPVKKSGLLVSLLLLIAFLAACGSDSASSEGDSEEGTNEESSASYEVEHAMGTTTLEEKPEKVVTLYQGANDTATAFGVTPVGIVESWVQQPVYDYLKEDLEGVEIVGQETQPNLEEIAALEPDLIVATKTRHEEVYEQLQQIAPTVATEEVFDFKGTVSLMGEALGEEEKAEEILNNFDERVQDLQGKLEAKLGDEWPLNISILNFRADHARIYFESFAGSILSDVGFERPENQQSDDWGIQLTDKESITEMNADVFYIFMEEDEAVKANYEEWTNHPLWANLDAVQNDQVYMVDQVVWNMAGGIKSANLLLDDLYDRFELEK
ncbi:iron-siderophore ABC transporter substrate-binding protein [Halobacillus fulvus]|nr:iron-siderophore ABC transporter substrate-binding protein [Halobacillus fulvus]